jgi:hypothetical protein
VADHLQLKPFANLSESSHRQGGRVDDNVGVGILIFSVTEFVLDGRIISPTERSG